MVRIIIRNSRKAIFLLNLFSSGGIAQWVNHTCLIPLKINVFRTHSLKIFNLAQQNLTKLLCRNCADNIKSIYRIRSYICLFFIVLYTFLVVLVIAVYKFLSLILFPIITISLLIVLPFALFIVSFGPLQFLIISLLFGD